MSFVKEIEEAIEKIYPLSLAESWDNVGTLLDLQSTDRKAMLCIDLSMEVLEECREKGISTVIAYHPPIFTPLKRITQDTPILHQSILQGVSIYSPHTSLDGGSQGMNAWLGSLVTQQKPFSSHGFMQYFHNTASIHDILRILSSSLKISCIRYALPSGVSLGTIPNTLVSSVGSGARGFKQEEEDSSYVLVTGEASHHDTLGLVRKGVSVVLLEHSRSERGFLPELRDTLLGVLPGSSFVLSEKDKDPMEFFQFSP